MKHFICTLAVILFFSFTLCVQAGYLNNVKDAVNDVVEPTIKDAVNEIVNADVVDWFKKTNNTVSDYVDELAKYDNVLKEAWETGWSHSGSLEYTGPLSPAANSGNFNVMTYNVDGLPTAIGGNSSEETKSISAILESLPLDIVVFQEDFTKHEELISRLCNN